MKIITPFFPSELSESPAEGSKHLSETSDLTDEPSEILSEHSELTIEGSEMLSELSEIADDSSSALSEPSDGFFHYPKQHFHLWESSANGSEYLSQSWDAFFESKDTKIH